MFPLLVDCFGHPVGTAQPASLQISEIPYSMANYHALCQCYIKLLQLQGKCQLEMMSTGDPGWAMLVQSGGGRARQHVPQAHAGPRAQPAERPARPHPPVLPSFWLCEAPACKCMPGAMWHVAMWCILSSLSEPEGHLLVLVMNLKSPSSLRHLICL